MESTCFYIPPDLPKVCELYPIWSVTQSHCNPIQHILAVIPYHIPSVPSFTIYPQCHPLPYTLIVIPYHIPSLLSLTIYPQCYPLPYTLSAIPYHIPSVLSLTIYPYCHPLPCIIIVIPYLPLHLQLTPLTSIGGRGNRAISICRRWKLWHKVVVMADLYRSSYGL